MFAKLFDTRFRYTRDVKLVNVEGTVPVSRLLFRIRDVRETRFPMLLGMDPEIELEFIAR
jgi:hypothetical protein